MKEQAVEATEARRRGMLLLEEAQRAIQRAEENPPLNPLIEPLRITPTDTSNHREEINGSETTPPEETVDQENPSSVFPQEGSSVTTTTQRRITRASSGMGVPNVLIDLITIYDDEESSEVSRMTPVPITEEEEPGETSAPTSDV
jgi:hypothetical protein